MTDLKQCDTENPCKKCPKAETRSNWKAIGCRRGTLKDEIERVMLCPQVNSAASSTAMISKLLSASQIQRERDGPLESSQSIGNNTNGTPESRPRAAPRNPNSGIFSNGCIDDDSAFDFDDLVDLSGVMSINDCNNFPQDALDLADAVNQSGLESNKRREKEVKLLSDSINAAILTTTDSLMPDADVWTSSIPFSLFQKLITNSKSVNGPLWSCVLAIVWELFEAPRPQLTIEAMAKEELLILLTSAARYQMESEEVGDMIPIEHDDLSLI
jgi:hypothetical protein